MSSKTPTKKTKAESSAVSTQALERQRARTQKGKQRAPAAREADPRASQRRLDKEITKTARRAAHQLASKPAKRSQLQPRLSQWLERLAHPFDGAPAKCPVNYNNAPSMNSMVVSVTATATNVIVNASSVTQYCFMAGHCGQPYSAPGDAESFHTMLANCGGTVVCLGPFDYNDGVTSTVASMGFVASGLVPGAATLVSSTAGFGSIGLANTPPIVAAGKMNHLRWKCIGMGVRVLNITPDASRGGGVTHCHPATSVQDLTTQAQFSRFPSYTVTEANSRVLEIAWSPLTRDLAYYHAVPIATEAASTGIGIEGALFVWLNAPAAAQTYEVQFIQHYEVAGQFVEPMATPTVLQPLDRGIIEPALQVASAADGGAHGVLGIAHAVADRAQATVSGAQALGAKAAGLSTMAARFLGF